LIGLLDEITLQNLPGLEIAATMQIIRNFADARLTGPTVLTIGTFDGLHRGHQDLINQLKAKAQRQQAQAAVIAFHPRPKTVLAPHLPGDDYLTTSAERIALFETLGVDVLVLTPFTIELSQKTAYNFIKLIVERLNIVQLCVGHDFALGKNREGNVEKLTTLGHEFNYTLSVIEPFVVDGRVISSTQVRQQLVAGNVRQATYLLGRYPALSGEIVRGAQRGQTIGFPTANFAVPAERLVPANGVYATFVRPLGQEQRYAGVTNVGVRPSFGSEKRTVETHIFDFNEDIYGQYFMLEFVERQRPEKKFDSIDSLVAQITQDSKQARSLLAGEVVPAT
jgi:riboflavin kinase/FMN adenylyltransferase